MFSCVIEASSTVVFVSHMFAEFMFSSEKFCDHDINSFMFEKYESSKRCTR